MKLPGIPRRAFQHEGVNVTEWIEACGAGDDKTGAARGAPACVDLRTYEVRVEGGRVYLRIG